jgi:hypothetical protein
MVHHDCGTFGHDVETPRTGVDGHKKGVLGKVGLKSTVFEGMEKPTGQVYDFAKDLTTFYKKQRRAPRAPLFPRTRGVQEAMTKAFGELERDGRQIHLPDIRPPGRPERSRGAVGVPERQAEVTAVAAHGSRRRERKITRRMTIKTMAPSTNGVAQRNGTGWPPKPSTR